MALKHKTRDIERASIVQRAPQRSVETAKEHERPLNPAVALQRATSSLPSTLRPADVLFLQRTVGNRAVQRMLSNRPYSLSNLPSTSAQTIQRQTEEEEEPLQAKSEISARSENKTGLPDRLKTGIENLSGLSLDDVRVHRNSSRPAEVQALAYTQGTDIHLGPNEEEHLPHEAWHVVQQKQGRVRPTLQAKGLPVNDDAGLEREADVMGARALKVGHADRGELDLTHRHAPLAPEVASTGPIQLKSKQQVTQEFDQNGIASNFTWDFAHKHIGSGKNTNMSAAKVHASRQNPPRTNTIIMDARDLKDELKAGTWETRNDRWVVTTRGNVALQSTVKRNAQITAAPANPTLLTITGSSAEAFTIREGAVTAVTGVTNDELVAAKADAGNYPTSGSTSTLRNKRRDYRGKIIKHVNDARSQTHSSAELTWVKSNFKKIGAQNLNNTVTTVTAVNGIASTTKSIKVHIGIASGDIFHYEG